ncbi:MBL fold metallo-hydrolase [candidate division KSB1 bacterium]
MKRRQFLKTSVLLSGALFSSDLLEKLEKKSSKNPESDWVVEILGSSQDGGVPHIGCDCLRCEFYRRKGSRMFPASLGLYNRKSKQFFLFDAAPDIREQLEQARSRHFLRKLNLPLKFSPDGIFLTHAHMGHYTGLMYYGFESVNAKELPIFCSEKMTDFLRNNGPWSQLVKFENIVLNVVKPGKYIELSEGCKVISFSVPHRQEYTDTLCFKITGPQKSVLYIPDIDRWEQWDRSITEEVQKVDFAVLDGTFFANGELPGRDMSKIPHPTVMSTIKLLKNVINNGKTKVYFTHLNHSNPLVMPESKETFSLLNEGFFVAREGMLFEL